MGDRDGRVRVVGVRFEHRRESLGIGADRPRLSWRTEAATAGWLQASYEVASSTGEDVRVETGQSVLVPWPFKPLVSRQRVRVRVRVTGVDGVRSGWSEWAEVEAGLFTATDWTARFVSPAVGAGIGDPCPLLRRSFALDARPVARARLYLSSLGLHEVEINGGVVGDWLLAPGWTSYHHRLRYDVHDVTALLRAGDNAIGAALADGWYRGAITNEMLRGLYGERLALLAQLEVTYEDGSVQTVATDPSWRSVPGPIVASGFYEGERQDARLEVPGWSSPGFDDSSWGDVEIVEHDLTTLVSRDGPPVRRTDLVRAAAVTTSPAGRTIVDFGQNLVGRVRVTLPDSDGAEVALRHAEVLEDGELHTASLRHATATDTIVTNGREREWEPRFAMHGFRYVEVDGWPGQLRTDDLSAIVVHSDMARTGWFSCSDARLNRLHENIVWSMRGNYVDLPTDCPQRDERLGWTGDVNAFAPTAAYLYDCAGLLSSWLADLAAEQHDDGTVPWTVPHVLYDVKPAAAWGDAAVVVPSVLHERFGDTDLVRRQRSSMVAWVDLVTELAGDRRVWDTGFQFGDWLDPDAPDDDPAAAKAAPALVATAVWIHSLDLLASALLEDEPQAAARYASIAREARAAFAETFVLGDGTLTSEAPTSYALALRYDLVPAPLRPGAGKRLVGLVRAAGHTIGTGFVGTPLICDALCDVGAIDDAYQLLMQDRCPSWLYPLKMGATTMWEHWDSIKPDGKLYNPFMNSFNHTALGSVGDFLHRVVGGLAPASPGYRRIAIAPRPGRGLTWATTTHDTPYGRAVSAWRIEEGDLIVRARVPPNTTAEVCLPDGRTCFGVGSGDHEWSLTWPA